MLTQEKGNILLSVVIAVVAVVSGLVFSSIAHRDSIFANYQLDMSQQLHLVRSELMRGLISTMYMGTAANHITLPIREVEIRSGMTRSTHTIKTEISRSIDATDVLHKNFRRVMTKAKTFRRPATSVSYYSNLDKSPVECAAVRTYSTKTLAGYMYFTDIDMSIFDTEVWFYGYDELWGKVHSNGDIHFKNVGGWPLFHDFVSTPQSFVFYPTPPQYDELFLGGWDENAAPVVFSPTADLIRRNGQNFPVEWNNTDILYCEVNDMQVTYYSGNVSSQPTATSFTIYDSYPPYGAVGNAIGESNVTFQDTLWSGPHIWNINEGSVMIYSDLWIKGRFHGAQTWGCSGDIYLLDDIYYTGTVRGNAPDGTDGTPVNQSDFLGLVSENSIYISYGYVHPEARDRRMPNCGNLGDTYSGIRIYAALCAMGDGDEMVDDGIFTFEYQFPHRSTPDTDDYSFIDFHLCQYPPTAGHNWPWPAKTATGFNGYPGTAPDYPWYNPLWPQWTPYLERGYIFLWGSVAQRRRGFVHRSGNTDQDNGWWDVENFRFGPMPVQGVNAPGATGSGIGYNKAYYYDHRFVETPPPDYPEVHLEGGQSQLEQVAYYFIPPPPNF